MSIDPAFDMPFVDYGPTGSFVAPATQPTVGPLDAPLVSLPCINPQWLRLVLGCVDQLRNRSSWLASYTDLQIVAILGAVEQLRVALQMANPCCDVAMRLESNCVLQFSTDGGVTWTDVEGWAANFDACVQGAVVPGVPLLPPGDTNDQRACNISAFLAEQLIQEAISAAVADFNASKTLVSYITDILPVFAYAFPITSFGLEAFVFLYTFITSANIADFEAAATDPALLELVTCAIYGAIRPPGYVTSANKAGICAAIGAIGYTRPDVIAAISGFCSRIGLMQMQAMQNVGIYNSGIDCAGCTSWCFVFDFRISQQGWTALGGDAHYNPGHGWDSVIVGGNTLLHIGITPAVATVITGADVTWAATTINGTAARELQIFSGGVSVFNFGLFGAAEPAFVTQSYSGHTDACDDVVLILDSDGVGYDIVQSIALHGTGPCPFGVPNC